MAYQPLEDLLPRSGYSIYKLIIMAARRATELADGKPRLIEKPSSDKTATIALEEILAGKIELKEVALKKGYVEKKEVKKIKEEEITEEPEKIEA